MNISDLLDDLKQNLSADTYIKSVWYKLNHQSDQILSKEDERIFSHHLPFSYNNFLQTCIEKLRYSMQEHENKHLSSIDYKYLIALLYYGLNSDDYLENVPIRAANIYILINSIHIDSVKLILQNDTMSNLLFQKCVHVMSEHLDHHLEIDHAFLIDISNYLITHAIDIQLENFIEALRLTCETNNTEIFKNFEYTVTTNKSFLSFYCMQSLVCNTIYEENKRREIVMLIVISLMKSLENENLDKPSRLILFTNIRKFFQIVLGPYITCEWFHKLFNELSKTYYDKVAFIHFISELSKEFYQELVKTIIFEMASDHSCKLQNVVFQILQTSTTIMEYFERKDMYSLIIRNIILLFGHTQLDVKEVALINFEKILSMRDPMIQEITQNIILADPLTEKINAITIFEILKQSDHVTWKRKKFNKSFINVSCHLFIKCPQYLTDNRMQHLELICLKAPSVEFKQCIPVLMKLLRELVYLYPKVIIFVLNVLIQHSRCTTSSTAYYYVKEFYELIYETTNTNSSSDIALEVTDILISPAYDYQSVFKKIDSMNLLSPNFLQRLFHKISLNQPRIWKIMNNVLDFVRCTTYPSYIDNYFRSCVTEHIFLQNYCGDMLSSFNKITVYMLESISKAPKDVEFMTNLENYLSESIQVHNVPIKYVALVLQLMKNLKKYNKGAWDAIDELFKELDEKLFEILQDIKLADNYEREIIYMGELVLLFDYIISERNVNTMQELFTNWNVFTDIPHIWSKLLVLYGKVCMKNPQHIDNCIIILELALKHGNGEVKHSAIAVLYDFCNIHLHHFEMLYPYLEAFLICNDTYLRYATGKLMFKLNRDEQLKLKYNQLIVLVLLFADENLKIRNYFQELSKESFLKKNEQIIANNFLIIIMHINQYMDHDCFRLINKVDIKLDKYSKERRCLIYKQLMMELSKYNQIQLLHQFTEEFMIKMQHKETIVSQNAFNVLEDIAYTIECMSDEKENDDSCEQQIKTINKDLAKKIHQLDEGSTNFEQNKIVVKLIQVLMQLINKFFIKQTQLSFKFVHSILLITKLFYGNVIASLKENVNSFRKTLIQLQEFYNKNKSHLHYDVISSN